MKKERKTLKVWICAVGRGDRDCFLVSTGKTRNQALKAMRKYQEDTDALFPAHLEEDKVTKATFVQGWGK